MATKKHPRIKEIRAFVIDAGQSGSDYHNQQKGHWIVDTLIANPMSVYEVNCLFFKYFDYKINIHGSYFLQKYKASRLSWGINALGECERHLMNDKIFII